MPGDALKDLAEYIHESLSKFVLSSGFQKDELVLEVKREEILRVLTFLRDDRECGFHLLLDICGVDYPAREKRFEIVYHLLSTRHNHRIRLKVYAAETEQVPSVIKAFSTAGWFEREIWDMYGVLFSNHPDLRRILTDYGFEGHPQRKDFPLTGYVELRYDEGQKRTVYEPVKLMQEYRDFDYLSPWEAMEKIQEAGDQKDVKPEHGYRKPKKEQEG